MSLVTFDHTSLALGGKVIVEDLALQLAERDRVGLIGPNGAGKSTLLRLIVGEQTPDAGVVARRRGLRLGYLPQEISVSGGRALLEFLMTSVPGRRALEGELVDAEAALAAATRDGAGEEEMLDLAGTVADLHERLAHFEGQYSQHEAESILMGLGFQTSDLGRDLGELSGGWRMRAVLASLLFQRPDLLLLDEPTNHLDMPSVAWFAGFLSRYDRAFVLISHDREFLNEQIRRVVSFEVEGVRTYKGDYDGYLAQRAEEEELLEARARNLDKEREHIEKFVTRFRAKASKASQVQSRVKALEKMEVVDRPSSRRSIRFRFPSTERPGKTVIEANGVDKSYGALRVLRGVDVRLMRGDRVAIIGVNGAGKTTLLRILAGELDRDAGDVTLGHKVKLGYYAQHHVDVLDPTATAYDEVARASTQGGRKEIRAALGALLFGDDDIEKKVGVLSGGERARVALARLLVDPGNVLLMDEPTNHLDLDSSERLVDALETYDGTLLFVSHNRRFVRRLATTIWHVEGGRLLVYPGTLDEYMQSAQRRLAGAGDARVDDEPTERKRSDKERKRREAERRNRLYPLRKKVDALEARVGELEAAQRARAAELEDPALYRDDERRERVLSEWEQAKKDVERLTAEWLVAQEMLEEAEADDDA